MPYDMSLPHSSIHINCLSAFLVLLSKQLIEQLTQAWIDYHLLAFCKKRGKRIPAKGPIRLSVKNIQYTL